MKNLFDRILHESYDDFDEEMDNMYESGYNVASDTIKTVDDILQNDEEIINFAKKLGFEFEEDSFLADSWCGGYKEYARRFIKNPD